MLARVAHYRCVVSATSTSCQAGGCCKYNLRRHRAALGCLFDLYCEPCANALAHVVPPAVCASTICACRASAPSDRDQQGAAAAPKKKPKRKTALEDAAQLVFLDGHGNETHHGVRTDPDSTDAEPDERVVRLVATSSGATGLYHPPAKYSDDDMLHGDMVSLLSRERERTEHNSLRG